MANETPFKGMGLAPAVDVNTIRARLREMDDFALIEYGKRMKAHNFRVELREARKEWRRRHPKQ
jgi:hypothetical protein